MIPLKAVLARASTSWDGGPGAELNITVAEKVPVVGFARSWLWMSRSSSIPLRAISWASQGALAPPGPAPVRGGSAPGGSGVGRDWGVSARLWLGADTGEIGAGRPLDVSSIWESWIENKYLVNPALHPIWLMHFSRNEFCRRKKLLAPNTSDFMWIKIKR